MRDLVHSVLTDLVGGGNNEGFQSYGQLNNLPNNKGKSFVVILTYVLVLLLILIFGKYLWNEVAIKLVPNLNPVQNIWQILGFSILLKLLLN